MFSRRAICWLLGLIVVAFLGAVTAPALAQSPTDIVAADTPNTPPASYDLVQHAEKSSALEALMFYIIAAVLVGSGLGICVTTNVVRMAVYLFATLASVAVLYFLLLANFIGVIQLIVYAGGTLILLIFGVMLTSKSPWARFDVKRSEMVLSGIVCIALAAALITVVAGANWPTTTEAVECSTVANFGAALMSTYLVPFEAVSVLLLVVMIGAALMARQE